MKFLRIIPWLCLSLFSLYGVCEAADNSWNEIKDKHFVVYYVSPGDSVKARKILNTAEEYYHKIVYRLGYSRYSNFWTWDERVKVILFPDKNTFLENSGQPEWSRGYADRYSDFFHSRTIVTYAQKDDFLHGLLPHEISHLVLWDFIGFDKFVPLWFEEGVAQFFESNKSTTANENMKMAIKEGRHIPFEVFMGYDIRAEKDTRKAMIFYSQSVSVVDFLMKGYGKNAFSELCRSLRDGKNMQEALRAAYYPSIVTVKDLETKWVNYIKK